MNYYELHDHVRHYINRQHTVLWGQFFDIHEQDGKDAAVDWLHRVIIDVMPEETFEDE